MVAIRSRNYRKFGPKFGCVGGIVAAGIGGGVWLMIVGYN